MKRRQLHLQLNHKPIVPMKCSLFSKAILLASLAALFVPAPSPAAENIVDTLEVLRATYRADRQTLLSTTLQLSESESAAFWPLYRAYRADIDKLGDGLVKLVLEYADVYPDVPEDRARQILKEYSALEEKLTNKRAWYFQRAAKLLPAVKALRWAQLENRMDLVLRVQLASCIPIVPAPEPKP